MLAPEGVRIMTFRNRFQTALLRALPAVLVLGLLLPNAFAVSLDQARFVLLTQLDGRLVGGGEFERDDGEIELDFEILERAQGPFRFSVHYRDGTVLIHDARLDGRTLLIEGSDGSWTSLRELARAHRIDLEYDRDDDLDDDLICLVPANARSAWWPYGEDDCD